MHPPMPLHRLHQGHMGQAKGGKEDRLLDKESETGACRENDAAQTYRSVSDVPEDLTFNRQRL